MVIIRKYKDITPKNLKLKLIKKYNQKLKKIG